MAERSNALVYLMISTLELKVEGSNPGIAVPFLGRQFSSENELIRVFSRDNSRNLAFGIEREFDLLGELRHMT